MRFTSGVVLSLCLTTLAVIGPGGAAHAAPKPGALGPDLFLAIGKRDLGALKQILARGADPNARNFLQMTPLMLAAASGQTDAAAALLAAGADLNATSHLGTALTFAGLGESAAAERFLLDRGAKIDTPRPDGITPLMLAARSGHDEIVKRLIAKKVDVNARNNEGATALLWAARAGRADAARLLLAAGARVDVADDQGWTPLMAAVLSGDATCARLLIDAGADLNAVDKEGRTALMLVAAHGEDPAMVQALIAGGARVDARDARGRTALALATARGNAAVEAALRQAGAPPISDGRLRTVDRGEAPTGHRLPARLPSDNPPSEIENPKSEERSPRQAAAAGLSRLEHSMRSFAERTGCASCHHEGLGRMATGLAREQGLAIDTKLDQAQRERIYGMLAEMRPLLKAAIKQPAATKNIPSVEIGDYAPSFGYLLAGLDAFRATVPPATGDAALILARQQAADGRWSFLLHRVPMQSSEFTTTALALQSLRAFAPKEHAAEIARRVDRARSWLLAAPAPATEDKASRLLGLKWAGASRADREKALQELRDAQRPDGGWSQLPKMPSDAYATGLALYALRVAGEVPATDPLFQRGVQFLLRTQEEDGTWFVAKRAIPANNYFDAEFPHGHSQYSSFAATSWATMALLLAADAPAPAQQAAALGTR